MFPGCTTLEIRAHHQELLREAEQKRLRQYGEALPAQWGMRLGRVILQIVGSLLAAIGS